MNLVTLATHNLKRRPIRTGLSILGVGLAVGSALALISLSHSIQDSAREGMDEMGDDLVVMQKGASDVFGGFIPEQTVGLVAATPGVTRVSGEMALFAPSGAKAVLTLGWPDGSYLWQKVPLRDGRTPFSGERHVVVLGDIAAASLGKKLDDEMELTGQTFRVVGIANYTTIVNRGLVLVPLVDPPGRDLPTAAGHSCARKYRTPVRSRRTRPRAQRHPGAWGYRFDARRGARQ
jgi:putative ABC transport system permease protein